MKVSNTTVAANALNVVTGVLCATNPLVSISVDTAAGSFVGTVRAQFRRPGTTEWLNFVTALAGPDPGLNGGVLDYGRVSGEWEIRAIVSAFTSGTGTLTLQVAA